MKKITPDILYTIIAGACFLFLAGAIIAEHNTDPSDWIVPDRFANMDNPVEVNNQSIRMGNSLFRRNCRDCHGNQGKGDGPESSELKVSLRDLSSDEVQSQTDGELFYKTREGRDEMPGFEADLHDEDIWHIVNFIRSLKK